MANGISMGGGLGTTPTISTRKKSSSGKTGKKTTGPGGGGRPRAGRLAGRPVSGIAGGGTPDLVRMGQFLSGGGVPGAGVPAVRPTPIPSMTTPQENLANMFGFSRGDGRPMQVSEQGVPYKTIVGDLTEDPGYLRPPTQQDIDYGERLNRAQEQKATGVYPMGWDPVLAEQRITAAERETGPGRKKDIIDPLRKEQYGPSTLQNMGDFLKDTYNKTLANVVPFAYLPGGGIWKSQWRNRPNEALPMRRGNIMRGEGTIADKSRASRRTEAEYRHKYYGTPDPGPRESNVFDELGMPQPKRISGYDDTGERKTPLYLREIGLRAEEDLGPYKVPPPGSDLGLPAGARIPLGLSGAHRFRYAMPDLTKGGSPTQDLPPRVQNFTKNRIEKPPSYIDFSGGRGGRGGTKEEEEKKTFNLLEMLMGLLGLGSGKSMGKSPQKNLNREPGPGEIDTRPAQFGIEPIIR